MCLKRKKEGKSKVLSRKFCLLDSGAVWQLFHLSPKSRGGGDNLVFFVVRGRAIF